MKHFFILCYDPKDSAKMNQSWIQDVLFLHLLQFLHEYYNWNSLIILEKSIYLFSKENKRLIWFSYNLYIYIHIYVYEYEFLLMFPCE